MQFGKTCLFLQTTHLMEPKPHWNSDIDYSSCRFYIRRMDTASRNGADEVPTARIPLIGFIFVTRGEVLVEAGGNSFLCQTGHVLIIPAMCPFSIRYYHEATGYTGAFSMSSFSDSRPLRFLTEPVHQAFWFDEGVFMAELFNMLLTSFRKGDDLFIEKGLDLFLSRIKAGKSPVVPQTVNRFLESLFDPAQEIGNLTTYAQAAGISENYLSRQVKQATSHSVGHWIDNARLVRAKRLLADTQLPIIEVATAVGLEDQSYFARFFRRETGQTPSEFRKAMHGKS